MNATSQERVLDNDANRNDIEELRLIKEALGHLAVVVDSLARIVDNRLNDHEADNHTSEVSNIDVRELGSQVVHLSEVSQEHDTVTEEVTPQPIITLAEPDMIAQLPRKPTTRLTVKKSNTPTSKESFSRGSRLHTHVILTDEIPHVELQEGIEPHHIHITSESTIAMNGTDLTLNSDQLFVFNAFMKLRDKDAIKAGDIQRLGFRTTHTSADGVALSMAIRQLRETFKDTADSDQDEFIARYGDGRGTFYAVGPAIITTGVVREKSIVTLNFGDGDNENQSVKLPDRFGEYRKDGSAMRLSADLPLTTLLAGKRVGDTIEYKDMDGQPTRVTISAIE